MKIGQPSEVAPITAQNNQASTARNAAPASSPARNDRKTPGVGVTVSELARSLENSGDAPEVDMEKVNAMREAIAQNSFAVNPEAIADKLLANAREMLHRSAT